MKEKFICFVNVETHPGLWYWDQIGLFLFTKFQIFKSCYVHFMYILWTFGLAFVFIRSLYKHFSIATYHPKTCQNSVSVFGGKVTKPNFFHLCKVTQCFGKQNFRSWGKKKRRGFFPSSLCKLIPLEWGVPPSHPHSALPQVSAYFGEAPFWCHYPKSNDWFLHNGQSTNYLPHAFRRYNVHDKKISVGQRQEDIRIISFEKGKGLKYSTSMAVEISKY